MARCMILTCNESTRSRFAGIDVDICDKHWFMLPLKVRQRWWRETDYGTAPASLELVLDIRNTINALGRHK